MSHLLTCPRGHQWEAPEGDTDQVADITFVCPVCGECSDEFPLPPPPQTAPPAVRALGDLLAMSPAGAPSDRETLPKEEGSQELPRIPGYEILGVLGRGGMGVVYQARQRALNRVVALKMVLSGAPAGSEERVRFRAEAEAAARLDHPNIVRVWEVGEHEGRPFLALEYVPAGTLSRKLNGTPLPPRTAAGVVEALARAVHSAHEKGVVHRDLKPGNVLLAMRERSAGDRPADSWGARSPLSGLVPKIADFGLAKRLDDDSGQTKTGLVLGTPSYMAPEQALGDSRSAGPPADIYALGAILYECLTGRPPFAAASSLETLEQVRTREPVPPRRLNAVVPRDLETICLKCLHKEPARRYASALDLADDLRRYRNGEPIRARPVGWAERAWRWCRRNPAVAALLAGILLAVAAGFAGVTWKWREAVEQRHRAETAEAAERERAESEAAARLRVEQARKDTAAALEYLATLFNDFGRLDLQGNRRADAMKAFRRACDLLEKCAATDESPALRAALAKSYTHLGTLQAATGDRHAAVQSLGKAVALIDQLPDGGEWTGDPRRWGETCFVLGAALMNLGCFEEAARGFRQAVRAQRRALDGSPQDVAVRKELSRSYFHLAHVQRQAGHVAESAATTRERQQLWPKEADELYDSAVEMARCAAAVGKGKPQRTAAEEAERRRYLEEALTVLQQAVAVGLKDAKAVRADLALKPLHGRAEFQQLLAEMEKREKK